MELSVGSSDRSWCLVGSMDSGEKNGSSVQNHTIGVQKSCAICNTTKTPLWRGGPAGPKVRINYRYIHNGCPVLRLYLILNDLFDEDVKLFSSLVAGSVSQSLCNACGIKYRKKSGDPPGYVIKQEKKFRANRRNRNGVPLKLELAASGRSDVLFQGLLLHKQRKLAEEEEAAVLLMALSWGLVN